MTVFLRIRQRQKTSRSAGDLAGGRGIEAMRMTSHVARVTAGGLSRYADLLMALAAFIALPLFSKGFFQQPVACWLESLCLHVLIACTLAWWLRVMTARTLTPVAAAVVLVYATGLVSRIKTGYLGTPLMPWDLLLAPQMLRLRETYPEVVWLAAAVPVLLCLMLFAVRRERPSPGRPWRRALLGGVLIATLISGSYVAVSPSGIRNMPWDQRENYRQHGFLLGLLLNAKGLWMVPPAVTTAEAAQRLLPYAPKMTGSTASARPDVIVILSESYSSLPEVFGLEGMQCFDAFRSAARMTTMVFGGYTANVEFELLTGYPVAFFPSGSVPWEMYLNTAQPEALPNQFRRLGYQTVALHPFAGSFWNRDHV
ncbi:MAG: hypothetical protein FGM62_08075, partial [Methylobacterium sp.]|nr:hypothetical protein [Methylobacterium sp.]